VSHNKLLPALMTLTDGLIKDTVNVDKRGRDARNVVNIASGLSGFQTANKGDLKQNMANLRTLENNMLSAALLAKEPGQSPEDIKSTDGTYIARAQKVVPQAGGFTTVSAQSPVLQTPFASAKFDLNFTASSSSAVSVRTSVQPKTKWALLPAAGSKLLSDLVDCTVIRDGTSVSTAASGFTRADIALEFPLSEGTGEGSLVAFNTESKSFALQFVDSTGKLSSAGCDGEVTIISNERAKYIGSCNHLTLFGITARAPVSGVPAPLPNPPVNPVPEPEPVRPGPGPVTPPAPPTVPAPPKAEEAPAAFPVWASVLIAIGGVAVLTAVGFIVKKRREELDNDRVKKIVAASLWKQTSASSSPVIPKPTASRYEAPASPEVVVPDTKITSPVASARSAPSQPPPVASTRNASSPPTRRQMLADLAGAIELGEGADAAAAALKPVSSRSRSPVLNGDNAMDVASSSNYSASKPVRESRVPAALPRSKSPRVPSNADDAQLYSSFKSSRTPSHTAESQLYPSIQQSPAVLSGTDNGRVPAVLPRSKSPYIPSNTDDSQLYSSFKSSRTLSNADHGQLYSSITSPARLDPVASSLRQPDSKTVRQQLADIAAASAGLPPIDNSSRSLPRSTSPQSYVSQSARARSSSRGRPIIPDLFQSSPPSSTATPPSIPRSARQLMAEIAAAGDSADFEPRELSPLAQIPAAASARLPRSRSRPVLDDPDRFVSGETARTSATYSPSIPFPIQSRFSPPSNPQATTGSPAASQRGSGLPDAFKIGRAHV